MVVTSCAVSAKHVQPDPPPLLSGSDAVLFLAGVLVAEEEKLYKAAESRSGGFRGWKNFIVSDIVSSADNVKTFTFRPETPPVEFASGFEFLSGQFLSASVDIHQNGKVPTSEQHIETIAPRHYTITVCIPAAPLQNAPLSHAGHAVCSWREISANFDQATG